MSHLTLPNTNAFAPDRALAPYGRQPGQKARGEAQQVPVRRTHRTSLVGRDAEVSAAMHHIESGRRLLTLVGPPGIGKTRLLEHVAREAFAFLPNAPLCWVDLRDARTLDDLVAAIARALTVSLALHEDTRAGELLLRTLRHRPARLLLDNFEQLPAAATGFVEQILSSTSASVVVTSRKALGVSEEVVVAIDALSPAAAVALCEENVRAQGKALSLDAMSALTASVFGNPLAIELCAPYAHLAAEREAFMADADKFAIAERALHWALLNADAALRQALLDVSVLRGDFTVQAAAALMQLDANDAAAHLQSLCELGLVQRGGLDSELRFAVTPFTKETIATTMTPDAWHQRVTRLGRYFAAAGVDDSEAAKNAVFALTYVRDPATVVALTVAASDSLYFFGSRGKLDALLGRALNAARTEKRLTDEAALLRVRAALSIDSGDFISAEAALERLCTVADAAFDDVARADAAWRRGMSKLGASDLSGAVGWLERAQQIAQKAGARDIEACALAGQAHALLERGETTQALDLFQAAVSVAYDLSTEQRSDRRVFEVRALALLGLVHGHRRLGQVEAAARRFVELEGLAVPQKPNMIVWQLFNRADVEHAALLRSQGRLHDADDRAQTATDNAFCLAMPTLAADALVLRARIHLDLGHTTAALAILDEAIFLCRRLGAERTHAEALWVQAQVHAAQQDHVAAANALERADDRARRFASGFAFLAAAIATERVLQLTESRDDDHTLRPMHGDPLAHPVARALGGSPLALALAADVVLEDAEGSPLSQKLLQQLEQQFARSGDEEVREALLALRTGAPKQFAFARRLKTHRHGHRARELVIAADGRSYEVDGRRTNLSRQRSLRLIFLALVEQAERAPGVGLTQAEVLTRGWPGEKMRPDSGATRVYTSIRRLRKSGLLGILLTRDDGYLLDPAVTVRREKTMRRDVMLSSAESDA